MQSETGGNNDDFNWLSFRQSQDCLCPPIVIVIGQTQNQCKQTKKISALRIFSKNVCPPWPETVPAPLVSEFICFAVTTNPSFSSVHVGFIIRIIIHIVSFAAHVKLFAQRIVTCHCNHVAFSVFTKSADRVAVRNECILTTKIIVGNPNSDFKH